MKLNLTRFKQLLGIVFHLGSLPVAPGTWASLAALLPIYFLGIFSTYGVGLLFIAASLLTLWTASSCEERWGPDPSNVVIDEWAGQAATFAALPFFDSPDQNLLLLATGFIFFRFFDIAKPLGIGKIQKLSGGWGILLDDVLAGIYAFISLRLVLLVLGYLG